MSKTLIILNPFAAGGRAGKLWSKIEPILWDKLGELVVAVTQNQDEVIQHLEEAHKSNLTRIVSIGGDGTNYALINAMAKLSHKYPDNPMVYGNLPIGTGRDWARSRGIPFDIEAAADWLANATPKPVDIGTLQIHTPQPDIHHFLNIASVGLGGEVDNRVNRIQQRRPWTFLKATVQTIINHTPQYMQIKLDGESWFEGESMLAVVANGTTFGHGMKIAPHASLDDGLFDVIVIETRSKLHILNKLRHVYTGTHLEQEGVLFKRASEVEIKSSDQLLALDLDGESEAGKHLHFKVQPGFINMLI